MNSACSAQLFGEVEFGGVRRAADTVDKRPRACEVNPASRKGPNIKINESELIEGIKNGARNWAPNDLGKKKRRQSASSIEEWSRTHGEASPESKKIKTSQNLPPNPSKNPSSSTAPRKSSNPLQIILILINASGCSSQKFPTCAGLRRRLFFFVAANRR